MAKEMVFMFDLKQCIVKSNVNKLLIYRLYENLSLF